MKFKKSTFITIGIFAVLIATAIWSVRGNDVGAWMGNRWWGMGSHHMMGGSMGFLMIVFWVVLIAAFIQFVSWTMNGSRNSQNNGDEMQTPLEILKIRLPRIAKSQALR